MELVSGIHNISAQHHGCVLSIGNFDGVHLGHQTLLRQLKEAGRGLNLPVTVMIFEPQPLEFFSISPVPARLTALRDKCRFLAAAGVDRLLCVKFDREFAAMSAESFVSELLVNRLGVKFLIIGDDFRFGADRQGDALLLETMANQLDFSAVGTESFLYQNGQRISSTAVRKALQDDDLQLAEALLGRPYSISGRVVHGNELGRTIGFPTANIPLKRLVSPIKGVYAVEIFGYASGALSTSRSLNNSSYFSEPLQGVANIGTRPTVSGVNVQLEVNIFDFKENIYGRHLEVVFRTKLRDEQRFASLAALKQQIAQDVAVARRYFELTAKLNHS